MELLAIAENRTPEKWVREDYVVRQKHGRVVADFGPHHTPPNEYPKSCKIQDERNADYAAACAGTAEAGWMATIAAIDGLLDSNEYTKERDAERLESIITAWPEELL